MSYRILLYRHNNNKNVSKDNRMVINCFLDELDKISFKCYFLLEPIPWIERSWLVVNQETKLDNHGKVISLRPYNQNEAKCLGLNKLDVLALAAIGTANILSNAYYKVEQDKIEMGEAAWHGFLWMQTSEFYTEAINLKNNNDNENNRWEREMRIAERLSHPLRIGLNKIRHGKKLGQKKKRTEEWFLVNGAAAKACMTKIIQEESECAWPYLLETFLAEFKICETDAWKLGIKKKNFKHLL